MHRLTLLFVILLTSSLALAGDGLTLSPDIPVTLIELHREGSSYISEQVDLEYTAESTVVSFGVTDTESGGVEVTFGNENYFINTWRTRSCRSFAVNSSDVISLNRLAAGTSEVIVATFDLTSLDEPDDLLSSQSLVLEIDDALTVLTPTGETDTEVERYLLATFISQKQEASSPLDQLENVFGRNLKGVDFYIDNEPGSEEFTLGTLLSGLCKVVRLEDNNGVAITNNDNNPVLIGLAIATEPQM